MKANPRMEPLFVERVYPPLVRNWLTPACRKWTLAFYGGRHFWFAWGWLLVVMLFLIALKFWLWAAGLAVMLALFLLTAAFDLATYPLRRR